MIVQRKAPVTARADAKRVEQPDIVPMPPPSALPAKARPKGLCGNALGERTIWQ